MFVVHIASLWCEFTFVSLLQVKECVPVGMYMYPVSDSYRNTHTKHLNMPVFAFQCCLLSHFPCSTQDTHTPLHKDTFPFILEH